SWRFRDRLDNFCEKLNINHRPTPPACRTYFGRIVISVLYLCSPVRSPPPRETPMLSVLRLPRPTDRWTRFLLAPALVFIATCIDRNYQTDLWHQRARGRGIVAEGRLVDTDRFTFTMAGKPFQDVNWLWQVAFYKLHQLGGLSLVQTTNSAVLAGMMTVLLVLAWRRSGSLAVASGVCVVAFFGLWQLLIIRPQTFSFLLFVVLYGV